MAWKNINSETTSPISLKGEGWETLRMKIMEFISTFHGPIEEAIRIGAAITIDVAIDQGDMKDSYMVFVIRCGKDFMAVLLDCGVALELSEYLP